MLKIVEDQEELVDLYIEKENPLFFSSIDLTLPAVNHFVNTEFY